MKNYKVINIVMLILAVVLLTVVLLFSIDSIDVTTNNKLADRIIVYISSFLSGCCITVIFNNFRVLNMNKDMEWMNGRLKLWNSISYRVKVAGEKSFNEMPLGIIVYDGQNRIEWANNYAKDLFKSALVEREISNINDEMYNKMKFTQNFDIDLYEKKVHVNVLKSEQIIFITDKTDLKNLEEKYFQRMQVAGIINLDNLEEALASTDAQEHTMVISNIMGILGAWCDKHNIYIRGYSEKQYIILMDRSQLDNVLADDFEVIENIKNYCYKENLRVTLSIGVACFDSKIIDVMDKADELLDLALNRGGNQAVVYIDGAISYYGGKAVSTESRTPVSVRVKAEELVELIQKHKQVYIMTHNDTDADAFGSTLAMFKLVQTVNKNVKIILEESQLDQTIKNVYKDISRNYINIMQYFASPSEAYKNMNDETLLIITDCQYDHLVSHPKILRSAYDIAIVDHHRSNDKAINNYKYLYNKPQASSTVELIVEMYDCLDEDVTATQMEASLMLLGIVVDTSNFMFRTSHQTFNVIAKLHTLNADMSQVKKMLREDTGEYNKKTMLLNTADKSNEKFPIVVCPEDEVYQRQFLAKISDNLITINESRAAFCIGFIEDNTVGISARSLGDVNVQIIMEQLEGGGHFNNAATQIKGITLEEAKERLLKVLEKYDSGEEENMKVILIEDVKGKGKKDDIIEVPSGYANFLIRSKKAILSTNDNLKELERQKEAQKVEALEVLEKAKKLKEFLDNNAVTISVKVGKEGQIYGSVSTKQIADEIKSVYNVVIDKRQFVGEKNLTALGTYNLPIQLHKEVQGKVTVHVVEKKA